VGKGMSKQQAPHSHSKRHGDGQMQSFVRMPRARTGEAARGALAPAVAPIAQPRAALHEPRAGPSGTLALQWHRRVKVPLR